MKSTTLQLSIVFVMGYETEGTNLDERQKDRHATIAGLKNTLLKGSL